MSPSALHPMSEVAGAELVGGKAAMLMRLSAKGFDVPPFLVIDPSVFRGADVEAGLGKALASRLPALGPGPYAARSSAREEDGASASHAGQFLSVLSLAAAEVPAAARRVSDSGYVDSVASYRSLRGLAGSGDAPAVIVQQMVKARCAGVAFTADPITGRRDRIIISAIAGLGDRLVGGEENGQGYVLAKDGGVVVESPKEPVLSPPDLAALHGLALKVEAECGGPQDIEWAFEGGRLFLLQARPITTPLRNNPVADRSLTVFDNSNIVESYPGLVTPLTFSFAQYAYSRVYRAFVRLIGVNEQVIARNSAVFDNLLARVDGRVYYNLGNWYRALAMLPGFGSNSASMELMMGVNEPLPTELVAAMAAEMGEGRQRNWLAIARVAWRMGREAVRLGRTRRAFYGRVESGLATPANTLDVMSLTELATEYRRIEADLLDRWDAPLVNDFFCMMAFGASRRLMSKWAGPAGLELHNDIMIGQGDIVSAEPAQRIRAMGKLLQGHDDLRDSLAKGNGDGLASLPELGIAIGGYLDKFADRCAEELKLESVPLDRDPGPLYKAVAAAALAPQVADAATQSNGEAGLRQLFARKPLRRIVAGIVLGVAKRRVRDRENLRFERTRIFGRGRRLFRAMGAQFHTLGLLAAPDDVFMLTVPEVLGAIEGFAVSHDLAALARLRKIEMDAASQHPDPGERLMVRGAVSAGLMVMVPPVKRAHDGSRERSGIGCSAGVVKAAARVVRDPRTESLARGEILVARHTDPGWIALFTNASAIVVERGSPLSHSAIVARELGIPCVVALKDAMSWISDGEVIEVDGATGLVRRVE